MRDVAKAPYTANIALLDQLNCRVPLENATIFQLQYIKSFGRRRGDDLLDPRQIRGPVFQLRANEIPQLADMSGYRHVRRNSPEVDVLLVEFSDVIGLVSHENGVSGGLQRGLHHRKRRGELISVVFAVRGFVRFRTREDRVLGVCGLSG